MVGLRGFLLFESSLEDMEHRDILRAIRFLLTLDDISEGGDQNCSAVELNADCVGAERVEGFDAVDLAYEVDLQWRVWPQYPEER